jgi:hypothetical protein
MSERSERIDKHSEPGLSPDEGGLEYQRIDEHSVPGVSPPTEEGT